MNVLPQREPVRSEVSALLVRWELRELTAQEVHESAELLLDDAPSSEAWPGVDYSDPRWGPRYVVDLLSDLAGSLYFPEDISALRALLEKNVKGQVRELDWKAYCGTVDWSARAQRATQLPYYCLWHRP